MSRSSAHPPADPNPFVGPAARRFQFSIGSLLALAALASAFLGLFTLAERGVPGLFYTLLVLLVLLATRPLPQDSSVVGAVTRYWRRQLVLPPTVRQRLFDLFFGVIMPIFCLWADFFVFHVPAPESPPSTDFFFRQSPPAFTRPLLWTYADFAYALIGAECVLLLIWLTAGRWLRPAAGFLGGALLSGSAAALLMGLILFPMATVGLLLMLTGALGYTPWLTAFVYFRQGRAALHLALSRFGRAATIAMALAGSLIVIILHLFLFRGPWLWE